MRTTGMENADFKAELPSILLYANLNWQTWIYYALYTAGGALHQFFKKYSMILYSVAIEVIS